MEKEIGPEKFLRITMHMDKNGARNEGNRFGKIPNRSKQNTFPSFS